LSVLCQLLLHFFHPFADYCRTPLKARGTQRALYIPPETSDRAGNLRLGDKLSAPYFPGQSHDKKLQQNEFGAALPGNPSIKTEKNYQ
jgi:hypothetical protein